MGERKTAIITGAGSGVGRQTALGLGRLGYNVALIGRTESKLEETARMAEGCEGEFLPLAYDVSDPQAAKALVKESVRSFGRLDAIVNNAGVAMLVPIDEITPKICKFIINTNLASVVNITAAAWPTLAEQKSGVIVNVSAQVATAPSPGLSIYAATKAAVNAFTLGTAREGAGIGVKAVAVAPGPIETAMLRGMFSESQLPPARTLDPAEVAKVICDCVWGERTFKPGEVITVLKH